MFNFHPDSNLNLSATNGYCRNSTKCSHHASQALLSRAVFAKCHAHKIFWALYFSKKSPVTGNFSKISPKKHRKLSTFPCCHIIFSGLSTWALANFVSHTILVVHLVEFLQYTGEIYLPHLKFLSVKEIVPYRCPGLLKFINAPALEELDLGGTYTVRFRPTLQAEWRVTTDEEIGISSSSARLRDILKISSLLNPFGTLSVSFLPNVEHWFTYKTAYSSIIGSSE